MKTLFSNTCRTLIIGSAIHLLIFSGMVVEFLVSPAPHVLAASPKQTQQAFKVFCSFYYHDGKISESEADADTDVCQKLKEEFASYLKQVSPTGYQKWPQASLETLARDDQLSDPDTNEQIENQEQFAQSIKHANNIKSKDLKNLHALVSGKGNSDQNIPKDLDFLPTLWDYNPKFDTATPRPNPILSTNPQILGHLNYIDLTVFCGIQGYIQAWNTDMHAYGWKCQDMSGNFAPFTEKLSFTNVCRWRTGNQTAEPRLIDVFNPYAEAWQCFVNAKLIDRINPGDLSQFCKSRVARNGQHFIGVGLADPKTAYDWRCVDTMGTPAGFSATEVCQWKHHKQNVIDRLVNYFDPFSWECWG